MAMREKSITSLLIGGPCNGSLVDVPCSTRHDSLYMPTVDDSVALLDGDQLLDGSSVSDTEYQPRKLIIRWPGGVAWVYHFWVHEAMEPGDEVPDCFHPSACYVERVRVEPDPRQKIDFTRGGIYRPSDN